MGWTYAFWALSVVAFVGAVTVDARALKRAVAGRLPVISLVLKGIVVLAFAAWMVYFNLTQAQGWEDLAYLAGILVLSVPTLIVAIVLDVFVAQALRKAAPPVSP